MKNKVAFIVTRAFFAVCLLLIAGVVALQSPKVQQKITDTVIDRLNASFRGEFSIGEMRILPFNALILRDVVLVDKTPYTEDINGRGWEPVDTVFKVGTLSATFSLAGLAVGKGIHIGSVFVSDALFSLAVEPDPRFPSNISRIFHGQMPSEEPVETGNIFNIRKAKVFNARYKMVSFLPQVGTPSEAGCRYDDLDVCANVTARNLKFSGGRMYATVDHCDFHEKRGYAATHMSGSCKVGMGGTVVEDFVLKDKWSDFRFKRFSMTYHNPYGLMYFTERTKLELDVLPGTLSMRTITGITGALPGNGILWKIRGGHAIGCLNSLRVDDFDVTDLNSGLCAVVNGYCNGLPDVEKMGLNASADKLRFTVAGLGRFISQWGADLDFRKAAPGRIIRGSAHITGVLNDMDLRTSLRSDFGSMKAQARLLNLIDESKPVSILLNGKTDNLDAGVILSNKDLGPVSMRISANSTFSGKIPEVRLDSLHIDRLTAFGYDYSGIDASGEYLKNGGNISVSSRNKALDLTLNSKLRTYGDRLSAVELNCKVPLANLKLMGIDKREGISRIACDISGNVNLRDGLNGLVKIGGLTMTDSQGKHNAGNLTARFEKTGNVQTMRFSAPFADIEYSGSGSFEEAVEYLQDISIRRELPSLCGKAPEKKVAPGDYSLSAVFHDSRDVLSYVMPGAYIADNSRIRASIGSDGVMEGGLNSSRLALGNNNIREAELYFGNRNGRLESKLGGTELGIGGIGIDNFSMDASADADSCRTALAFRLKGEQESRLSVEGLLQRKGNILFADSKVLESELGFGGRTWTVPESGFSIEGTNFKVNGFSILSGKEEIRIDGGVSSGKADTLSLKLSNLELASFNEFLNGVRISGVSNGKAIYTSGAGSSPEALLNLRCDSLCVGKACAGSIRISGMWEKASNRIKAYCMNESAGRKAVYAGGEFNSGKKTISARATLDRFGLDALLPLTGGVFSNLGGSLSGEVNVSGSLKSPSISSKGLYLENALAQLAYTGVSYTANGPLKIDGEGVHFKSLEISDSAEGSAHISGGLLFNGFKNPALDISTDFANLLALDSGQESGLPVYGHLKASGSASVKGPFNALGIDADVQTIGEGDVHIPLSGALVSQKSNLLTFKNPEIEADPYEEMIGLIHKRQDAGNMSDIRVNAHLELSPRVKALAEIDKSTGHSASIAGKGSMDINIRPKDNVFNITGDYSITSGNYHFVLPGILEKDFDVESGSSVSFGGPIVETTLDIKANHLVKTSLGTLIADSTAVATRRPVNCGISISDKIANPQFAFSIDVPDLEPNIKSQVESALNTDDKIQKQFVALLLFGTFLPSEQSGVVNGTNVLFSNVSEVMSSQVNSIMQKLDIPMDFGFGYQRNDTGENIFDVAISTQLWNNRVVVGGTIGNRQYSKSSGTEMVGDLDIQVKLDKQGQFRLNLFSHSADEFTSFLDYSQRNGIGISYQKEYKKLKDLFRKKETK